MGGSVAGGKVDSTGGLGGCEEIGLISLIGGTWLGAMVCGTVAQAANAISASKRIGRKRFLFIRAPFLILPVNKTLHTRQRFRLSACLG
jgi:hypothetical protein